MNVSVIQATFSIRFQDVLLIVDLGPNPPQSAKARSAVSHRVLTCAKANPSVFVTPSSILSRASADIRPLRW
jgi:hypothetical protein